MRHRDEDDASRGLSGSTSAGGTTALTGGTMRLVVASKSAMTDGTTCVATMLLGDDLLHRELAHEATSRGRKDNRIHMCRTTVADLDLPLEDGPNARTVDAGDPIDILAAGFERRPMDRPTSAHS